MNLMKEANQVVRLFCALSTLPLAVLAEDFSPPEHWTEPASSEDNGLKNGLLIPRHERELVSIIYQRILKSPPAEFAGYLEPINGTDQSTELVAIEGGSFLMGSPPDEAGRFQDEGPQRKVTVSDFWMGRYEVTWGEFLAFGGWEEMPRRKRNGTLLEPEKSVDLADWVSAPTEVYVFPDMGMGLDDDFPAVGMTQHAANKFCQWLSLKTGHFYRLPTEAEWEYACRAGTTDPYHCPIEELSSFAVLDPSLSRIRYEKVGSLKPNAFGLHDMHGNVLEWCIDGYSPDAYRTLPENDPWSKATQRYPRVVRGGSWYDENRYARSAQRLFSHPNWNIQDPQIPRSVWWLVDAMWVGFRIVRPREIPSEAEMFEAWNTGAMHLEDNDIIPESR